MHTASDVVADLLAATERAFLADDGTVALHQPGPDLADCLNRFEAETHDVLMSMQRHYALSGYRTTRALDLRSRARGVREQTVFERRRAWAVPLLSSIDPGIRVGPVAIPLMISDRRRALVPVPPGVGAEAGCCRTEDPTLVGLAISAFTWVWERSVGWEVAGLRPPLPTRRLEVAILLVHGHSDREIADELGVISRTVSQEVRAVVDWLGARNRTHAVAMLVGAA